MHSSIFVKRVQENAMFAQKTQLLARIAELEKKRDKLRVVVEAKQQSAATSS